MALKMDIVVDGATARFVSVAKATKLAGALPVESGKSLVSLSMAVREFSLAREPGAALSVLTDIQKLVEGHDDPEFVAMIGRHVKAVTEAHKFYERKV